MITHSVDSSDGGTVEDRLVTRRSPVPAVHVTPEFVLTECPRADETPAAAFRRLAATLAGRQAHLLSLFIFGSLSARPEIDRAMHEALGDIEWPVTWVDGAACDGRPLAGLQAFAISRARPVTRVRLGHRVVGSVFEDGQARHCLFGGLGPTAVTLQPAAQVQQTFGNFEWALDRAGFALRDVVRTWFYNDDIVAWYGDFNRVRTAYYADVGWRTGAVPASTGIGARNAAGAALVLAAWAVQPLAGGGLRRVDSPLQCPAPAYGSAFSRAMEIETGGWRRLLVSGTASIHPDGRTAWIGDARKQVDLTMEVVGALLQSRGMTYRDITRATAYFEHPLYERHFAAWCVARDLDTLPVISTHCDICRDDLLFELELDACSHTSAEVNGARTYASAPKNAQETPSRA